MNFVAGMPGPEHILWYDLIPSGYQTTARDSLCNCGKKATDNSQNHGGFSVRQIDCKRL